MAYILQSRTSVQTAVEIDTRGHRDRRWSELS